MCPDEMRRYIKEAVDEMDDTALEQLYWMLINEN